jgi:hypothetical protein
MTDKEFIERVIRMRELQRKYFKDRDYEDLRACRKIEAEVDAAIKQMTKPNNQLNLFI